MYEKLNLSVLSLLKITKKLKRLNWFLKNLFLYFIKDIIFLGKVKFKMKNLNIKKL